MGDLEALFYCFVAIVIGITLFVGGFKSLRQKRLIESTPTSKVRSIAMGLVEVYGEVVPAKKKLLKSPLTGKDCVYYKYQVEEYRRSGKSSRWVVIDSFQEGTHFFLKDDTGCVLVEPAGANVDIPADFTCRSGAGRVIPDSVKGFMTKKNLPYKSGMFFSKELKFTEYLIEPKDKLYIMGTAGDNPFVEEATGKENVEDIMIQKGKHEKIYYISDKPEKDILKKFKWAVIGGLFGGGALIVLGLAGIFIYFGVF
ncbi:MAG TPA: GIDE domain-containing protein [Candidatus Nanoarchaeia archaeon]|nr:GIDE domain-containing protein [Candidatus Nanoarchaeia archaeon]